MPICGDCGIYMLDICKCLQIHQIPHIEEDLALPVLGMEQASQIPGRVLGEQPIRAPDSKDLPSKARRCQEAPSHAITNASCLPSAHQPNPVAMPTGQILSETQKLVLCTF